MLLILKEEKPLSPKIELNSIQRQEVLRDLDKGDLGDNDYTLLFDGASTKVSNAIAYVLYKGRRKVA